MGGTPFLSKIYVANLLNYIIKIQKNLHRQIYNDFPIKSVFSVEKSLTTSFPQAGRIIVDNFSRAS